MLIEDILLLQQFNVCIGNGTGAVISDYKE